MDVSGHSHTVLANSDGSFLDEIVGFTKPAGAIPSGRYAVVYNECQDGVFAAARDTVFDPAFEVNVPADAEAIDLTELKADAREHKETWESIEHEFHTGFKTIKALEAAEALAGASLSLLDLGGNPIDLVLFILRFGQLPGPPGLEIPVPGIPNLFERAEKAALGELKNVAKHYEALELDPPDPNFQQITSLGSRQTIDAETADPLVRATSAVGSAVSNEDALVEALRVSIERYQGAAAAHDGRWALIHARATRQYAGLLAAQQSKTNAAISALATALAADGRKLDAAAADLERLRSRIAASGFSSSQQQAAERLGLSGGQFAQLLANFVADNLVFKKATLIADLTRIQDADNRLAGHLGTFASRMDAVTARVKANPLVPDQTPIANAGGPYGGTAGTAITFNGGASTSPTMITRYEWDLTGSGAFADATGRTPSFTSTRGFIGPIGVKVTNAAGLSNVAYAGLEVRDTKRPPVIATSSPTGRTVQILVNTARAFSVTASDPDGEAVTTEWFLDGRSVAKAVSFNYQTAAKDVGVHRLEAVATGAGPLGKSVRLDWAVGVVTPGPPDIVASVSPAPNAEGWNNTDVTVRWALTDPVGIATKTGCDPSPVTAETAGITLTCTAKNTAGVSASKSVTVKLDKTPPTITASRTPAPNAAGWNNGPVTVSFTCNDALSGIAECPAAVTLVAEGANQTVTRAARDRAGNTKTATVDQINIDRTPPITTATATPAPDAKGFNTGDVTVQFNAVDNPGGSGVQEIHVFFPGVSRILPGATGSVKVIAEGNTTLTYFAVDKAGNQEQPKRLTVSISRTAPVIRALVNPAPNAEGWNNTDVTVSWSIAAPDGIASTTACDTTVLKSETNGTFFVCSARSNSGHFTSESVGVRIDKTPPTITPLLSPPPNAEGWNSNGVSVFFRCEARSGVATCSGPVTLTGEGVNQSAAGTATSRAGNHASLTVTGIKIDSTPPTTVATVTPPPNADGFNKSTVRIDFSATKSPPGSGVKEIHVRGSGESNDRVLPGSRGSLTISTEGGNTLFYFAVDRAGNREPGRFLNVNIDRTPPTTTATTEPEPNVNGFIHGAASVHLSSRDPNAFGSGVREIHVSLRGAQTDDLVFQNDRADVPVSAQGYTRVTYFAVDRAGNQEAAKTLVVRIDTSLARAAPGFAVTNFVTDVPGGRQFGSTQAGPMGLAFDSVGNLFVMDIADGHLYKFGPSGGVASQATRVTRTPIDGGPLGLAFDKQGRLYLTRLDAGDVLELDPATGAILRTVAKLGPCQGRPGGNALAIATDPLSGDLFVSALTCGIVRISNFASGPGKVTEYAKPGSTDGITFAPDGTLYVEAEDCQDLCIGDGAAKKVSGTNAAKPGEVTRLAAHVVALDGIAVAAGGDPGRPPFLYGNTNLGTIKKIDLTTTPPTLTDIVTEGTRGDLVTVGPDRCLYATQSTTILKVTSADGSCALAPATVLASVGLAPSAASRTVRAPHTLTASLSNVSAPAGLPVTFTVIGANPQSRVGNADSAGKASFTYVGANPGVDRIVAKATIGSVAVSSNLATVTWAIAGGSPDRSPPVTTPAVSPAPNANGWNNSDVVVDLSAVAPAKNTAVKDITAALSGAQNEILVTPGDHAPVTIVQEGTTTLTFFATDTAGNQEVERSLTIRIDKTPPTIKGSRTPFPGPSGWNRTDVVVTFECSDALSGVASCPAPTLLTTDGAEQSVTGTAVDKAGNTATATVDHIKIDKTPPTTTAVATRAPHQVTVRLEATDNPGGSGVREIRFELTGAQTGSGSRGGSMAAVTVTAKGVTTLHYFAIDVAGNREPAKSLVIAIDTPPPTITGSRTPPANAAGWNNADVTVSFTCAGVAGVESCTGPTTLKNEGAGQSVTGRVVDRAGNTATATVSGINIDKTPPTTTAVRTQGPAGVTVAFKAEDNPGGSGVKEIHLTVTGAERGEQVVPGDRASVTVSATGTTTIRYFATDRAGNQEQEKILAVTLAALTASGRTITATEGIAFTGVVASLTGASSTAKPSDFSATIDWGDNSRSAGTVVGKSGGGFEVRGSHTYAEEGTFTVRVTITDLGGSTATATGAANVLDAALSAAGRMITPTEGLVFSGAVASFRDANPGAKDTEFTASINWGDGSSSPGTVVAIPAGGFEVRGSHTYAEEGSFTTTTAIKDAGGSSATATGVANVLDAALSAAGKTIDATEGIAFSGAVASFKDANPGAKVSEFTASIDWGDGSTSAGRVVATVGGGFDVIGSHIYSDEGRFTITVSIKDQGGSKGTATSTARVADAALTASAATIDATEGLAFSGAVASFTDANPAAKVGEFMTAIDWGDGSTSAGTVVANSSGGFDVKGRHTFAEEGTFTITVTIRDQGGSTMIAIGAANVLDAPLGAVGKTIDATEGIAFSGAVASFTDANPAAKIGEFTGTINWGDGATSAGTVAANSAGGFDVKGSHTFAEEGRFTITVTIKDQGGSTATAIGAANVLDAALSAVGKTIDATEGLAFSGVVAGFRDANPAAKVGEFTATIGWGDGSTSAGRVVAGSQGGFDVIGNHIYAEEDRFTITVTVKDQGGSTAAATSTARVADAALTATGTTIDATEGVAFSGMVASFTDANPRAVPTEFTATIDWGDKTAATSGTIAAVMGGFAVSGTHTYAEEGTYKITVTNRDVGGSVAVASSTAKVVDAPLMAAGVNVSAVEGQPFTGLVATFTDANSKAPASDFTATINWGDGTPADIGTTITLNPTAKRFEVRGSHTYAEEGTFRVTVTIKDVGGISTSAIGQATVDDARLTAAGVNVSAVEGQPFTSLVATFTDANPRAPIGDFTATISWGDGTPADTGTIITLNPTAKRFEVRGSHTYPEEGTFRVTVMINDVGGSSASAVAQAKVDDAALMAAGVNVSAVEGQPFTGLVATFTDANPRAPISDFTAVIAWGDATTSAGVIGVNPTGGFTISGSHVYAEEGTYPITVTIKDVGGSLATAISVAAVVDAPLTASPVTLRVSEERAFTAVVATFVDANPLAPVSDFTAMIDWGDGTRSAGAIVANTDGSFSVVGTHTYAECNDDDHGHHERRSHGEDEEEVCIFTITVSVRDVGGSTATATSTAIVVEEDEHHHDQEHRDLFDGASLQPD